MGEWQRVDSTHRKVGEGQFLYLCALSGVEGAESSESSVDIGLTVAKDDDKPSEKIEDDSSFTAGFKLRRNDEPSLALGCFVGIVVVVVVVHPLTATELESTFQYLSVQFQGLEKARRLHLLPT